MYFLPIFVLFCPFADCFFHFCSLAVSEDINTFVLISVQLLTAHSRATLHWLLVKVDIVRSNIQPMKLVAATTFEVIGIFHAVDRMPLNNVEHSLSIRYIVHVIQMRLAECVT